MLRIGLTGGIGSGKSTVASAFAELGVPIIDADKIAHEITGPGTQYFEEIADYFNNVLKVDGTLDRPKIKEIIFNNPEKKTWLEALLHPAIRHIMEQRIKELDCPYCILVIPLLAEAKDHPLVDRTLVVDASRQLQIKRVRARDALSDEQINRIIDAQAAREERLKKADDVITNDENVAALKRKVAELHHKYSQNS